MTPDPTSQPHDHGAAGFCTDHGQPPDGRVETVAGVCSDCGRRYGDEYGFPDLVIPHDVWKHISPSGDEGGLLCPSCICRRLYDAGITTEGWFTSGPLAPDTAWPLWASPAEASALDRVRALADELDVIAADFQRYPDQRNQGIAEAWRVAGKRLRAALDPEEPR